MKKDKRKCVVSDKPAEVLLVLKSLGMPGVVESRALTYEALPQEVKELFGIAPPPNEYDPEDDNVQHFEDVSDFDPGPEDDSIDVDGN